MRDAATVSARSWRILALVPPAPLFFTALPIAMKWGLGYRLALLAGTANQIRVCKPTRSSGYSRSSFHGNDVQRSIFVLTRLRTENRPGRAAPKIQVWPAKQAGALFPETL